MATHEGVHRRLEGVGVGADDANARVSKVLSWAPVERENVGSGAQCPLASTHPPAAPHLSAQGSSPQFSSMDGQGHAPLLAEPTLVLTLEIKGLPPVLPPLGSRARWPFLEPTWPSVCHPNSGCARLLCSCLGLLWGQVRRHR